MTVCGTKQESHPEQQRGEVFVGYFNKKEFTALEWTTKREGQMVFGDDGNIIGQGKVFLEHRRFPVFILRTEREEKRRLGSPFPHSSALKVNFTPKERQDD